MKALGALAWMEANGVHHGNLDPSHFLVKASCPPTKDGAGLSTSDEIKLCGFGAINPR